MKWKVEYITPDICHVLIDDPTLKDEDKELVGAGFPPKLAERLVKLHNEDLDNANPQKKATTTAEEYFSTIIEEE